MIKDPSNFIVLLETLSLEETNKIPDFREVNTIAAISDEEFWEHYNEKRSNYLKEQQMRRSFITNLKDSTKTKSRIRILTQKRRAFSELKDKRKGKQNERFVAKTSTPAKNLFRRKSVHFDHIDLPREPIPRKKPRPIEKLTPINHDLLDLIPPDVDALDLDSDLLLSTSQSFQESDYDSVSCESSDDSYYSCDDNINTPVARKPIAQVNCRPGIKLDIIKLKPPSKEAISSMPVTCFKTCDKPTCGFETNYPTNVR